MEQVITPKSVGGFVRSLSGFFITKENPLGLTPKECIVLSILRNHMVEGDTITRVLKLRVSNDLNQSLQVTTNYINKFKKKGVITKDSTLHPLFFKHKIIIDGTHLLQPSST